MYSLVTPVRKAGGRPPYRQLNYRRYPHETLGLELREDGLRPNNLCHWIHSTRWAGKKHSSTYVQLPLREPQPELAAHDTGYPACTGRRSVALRALSRGVSPAWTWTRRRIATCSLGVQTLLLPFSTRTAAWAR